MNYVFSYHCGECEIFGKSSGRVLLNCLLVPVNGTQCFSIPRYLENFMLPDFGKQFGDAHFLFQHDCAPLHKSRYLKIWTNVFVMEELDWPAWFPVLNPRETPLG